MKLVFEQHLISEHLPESLKEELDFKGFLSLFDLDIPMIPQKILRPFNREEGIGHFNRLSAVQRLADEEKLDLNAMAEQMTALPALDEVLPFFETRHLEQYHLHQLGIFVAEDQRLAAREDHHPLTPELQGCCKGVSDILAQAMRPDFSNLKLSEAEQTIQKEMEAMDETLKTALTRYEKNIQEQTGLRMIYPYPKEVSTREGNLAEIQECPLLSVTDKGYVCFVDYVLPESVQNTIDEKERLSDRFGRLMEEKLARINRQLHRFYADFSAYYNKRKDRIYLYALLHVKAKCGLCLPEFQETFGCDFTDAELPCMKGQTDSYVPLSITLRQGSNLLFGANMTGKTTVLKTVYFHLMLIHTGIPVPAAAVRLHFPEHLDLHLKTSGDLRRKLSSFGEEIQFFCRESRAYSFILADELFQSTDPVSGVALSKIFLAEHAGCEGVFFCTSHYPDVLFLEDLILFRMKDVEINETPYSVERIFHDRIEDALKESRRSLQIALQFPLSDAIKKRIHGILRQKRTDMLEEACPLSR